MRGELLRRQDSGEDLQLSRCRRLYSREGMSKKTIRYFRQVILQHYHHAGRNFSWREIISPYRVLVSEIMLQQTQTHRVAGKFEAFLAAFPDFNSLATAPFKEVLTYWKGLGYNRRALNLQIIARTVEESYRGILPDDPEILRSFPGIGAATAASICTFAYNQPQVFIETNLRTLFIHFFFPERSTVNDKELLPLIAATLETSDPRSWYYALMDYGVMVKKNVGNLSRKSSSYRTQSSFVGSNRQLRGQVLQALLDIPSLTREQLAKHLDQDRQRIDLLVAELHREGFIKGGKNLQL